jgi:hypothetical protein
MVMELFSGFILQELIHGISHDKASNKELDVPDEQFSRCPLHSIYVNFAVLVNVIRSVNCTDIGENMFNH